MSVGTGTEGGVMSRDEQVRLMGVLGFTEADIDELGGIKEA